MRHTELFYLLALQKAEGIGDVSIKKLLAHCGSAEAVFQAKWPQLAKIDGIGTFRLRNIHQKSNLIQAESELSFIEKHGIRAYSFLDDDYPFRLKHCPDGPVLLFSSGNIDLAQRKIISIVGTRQATPHGIEACRKIIADLTPVNPVIVSGFAYGIDIAAHLAALDNGLQTIGVLAHGLDQIYPKQHQKYARQMEANGGFFTEFRSKTEPSRENFLKRNRIVAGISEATIVIESAEKGGSLVTANIANDYNRDVFAVPGRVTDHFSRGCHNLIKSQKAMLLTGAADLVYQLNWDLQHKPKPMQAQLFLALDPEEQTLYDFLKTHGKQQLDHLALGCGLPVSKTSSVLLGLELKNAVRPLPGKSFEVI